MPWKKSSVIGERLRFVARLPSRVQRPLTSPDPDRRFSSFTQLQQDELVLYASARAKGINPGQFQRWLRERDIRINPRRSGGGHKDLFYSSNGKWPQMPTHGGKKQLGTGLMRKIEKDLGLE